jgi:O-antigen/teichoic acid export membrane protein
MFDPRTTFRSAVWNHAGKILEYLLMYVTSVLIARGLGVEDNGAFVGLFSISQLLLVLTSFGLEVSVNKHIPQLSGDARQGNIRHILRRALLLRIAVVLVGGFALLGILKLAAGLFPEHTDEYVWILVGYTGIRSLVNLLAISLTAELRTRATSTINVMIRALEAVVVWLMVANGMTILKLFLLFFSTATLQLAAYVVAARPQLFGHARPIAVLPIITFGGVYWTNTIVEFFLGRQGDVLLLTVLLPDSSQASLYDVAFTVSQLAALSMTVGLGGVTLATSARLAIKDDEILRRFYGFMIRVKSLLSIPLYAFILFNADSVLHVLYSSRYLAAAPLIQGIAAFRIVSRLFGGPENAEFLLSQSHIVKLVGIGIIGAVINISVDLLLIPTRGATGAVIGSGVGNLAVNFLGVMAVRQLSGARLQWQFWMNVSSITCAASFLCSMIIPRNDLPDVIVQAVVFLTTVLVAFRFTKPLTSADADWLLRVDDRFRWVVRYFVRNPVGFVGAKSM